MLRIVLGALVALIVIGGGYGLYLTRDGERVIPRGEGLVTTASGEFEGAPLPDYAAGLLPEGTKSYFVEPEPGIKIHVLDVGEGQAVYLQHGNPTNALLYRKVAAQLPLDQYRLVMPTMIGLGQSTKIPASQHTLDNHLRWMSGTINQLGVEDVIYVGQDWGGPIGMGVMARNPDLLKGVVAMNTGFIAPREERDLSSAHAMANRPFTGELMLEGLGLIWDSLPDVQGDPASMPEDVVALYSRPVLESGNAKAPLALMRMVPTGPDHPSAPHMREIETYVAGLDVPASLVWGMKDPILAQGLEPMKAQFPNAPVTQTQAGHFLQEEVPAEIAAAIIAVHAEMIERASAPDANTADGDGQDAPSA